jgi:hypothetical protein
VIGLDGMDNERTNTTHNDTSSMQVGVFNQRLTTISTFAPGGNILIVNFFCVFKNVYYSSNLRFQENRFFN